MRTAIMAVSRRPRFIGPECPWTIGKTARFNRTLQTEWADRQVVTVSNPR
jgi:hypothetical protein